MERWYQDICNTGNSRYTNTFMELHNIDGLHSLSLYNVSGAFFILSVGLVMAAIAFFLELIFYF